MKVLRVIWLLLLTALVTVAFVYPFYSVPERFEQKARSMTEARIAESGADVEPGYVEQSVREAMRQNTPQVLRTAFLTACCLALIAFLLGLRPPHDCGGFNWFNPLALLFTAPITLLAGLVVIGFGPELMPDRWGDFIAFCEQLRVCAEGEWNHIPYMLIAAVMMAVIFRGIVFSFLERVHPIAAIVLAPVICGLCVYLAASRAAELLGVFYSAPFAAAAAACFIGFIEGLVTWRLRSGIPAVLSHLLLAYASPGLGVIAAESSAPLWMLAAVLAVLIAVFMLLPKLSSRVRVLATDYPFTVHHIRMHDWLYGRGVKTGYKASSLTPAERGRLEIKTRAEAAAGREAKAEAAESAEKHEKTAKNAEKRSDEKARKKAEKSKPASEAKPGKAVGAAPETQAHDPKASDEKIRAARAAGTGETEANVPAKGA
ncbi:MAG: hypothetical protein IKS43_05390 [Clostridia bacterium]|nr:hypothetical protein [Clostridia bacterium]